MYSISEKYMDLKIFNVLSLAKVNGSENSILRVLTLEKVHGSENNPRSLSCKSTWI